MHKDIAKVVYLSKMEGNTEIDFNNFNTTLINMNIQYK